MFLYIKWNERNYRECNYKVFCQMSEVKDVTNVYCTFLYWLTLPYHICKIIDVWFSTWAELIHISLNGVEPSCTTRYRSVLSNFAWYLGWVWENKCWKPISIRARYWYNIEVWFGIWAEFIHNGRTDWNHLVPLGTDLYHLILVVPWLGVRNKCWKPLSIWGMYLAAPNYTISNQRCTETVVSIGFVDLGCL